MHILGFPGGSEVKVPACNVGDLGSIPQSGRFPGEGNDNPLQYSYLENPMDREPGGLQSTGHKESDMTERLSTAHMHILIPNSKCIPVFLFLTRILFSMS